jgi:hypothetical protein
VDAGTEDGLASQQGGTREHVRQDARKTSTSSKQAHTSQRWNKRQPTLLLQGLPRVREGRGRGAKEGSIRLLGAGGGQGRRGDMGLL